MNVSKTTSLLDLLRKLLQTGFVYLRPVLHEDFHTVGWMATYEFERAGVWHQNRADDVDPFVALTRCLIGPDVTDILEAPFEFPPAGGLTMEEEEVPTALPPRDWNLPTRARSLANTHLPASEILREIRCHWCLRQREPADLTITWNLDFICLTDTEHCIQEATGRPASSSPANAQFVAAGVPTNGNASPKPAVKSVDKDSGRIFECSECHKKKRTRKTRGRLPTVCSACKEKKS